jgi:hypothetical protein
MLGAAARDVRVSDTESALLHLSCSDLCVFLSCRVQLEIRKFKEALNAISERYPTNPEGRMMAAADLVIASFRDVGLIPPSAFLEAAGTPSRHS